LPGAREMIGLPARQAEDAAEAADELKARQGGTNDEDSGTEESNCTEDSDESDDEGWLPPNPFKLNTMRPTFSDLIYCTAWKNDVLAVGMGQCDARVMILNSELSLKGARVIGAVNSLAWNASGEVLACAVDYKVVLFDRALKVQRAKAPSPCESSPVSGLAWHSSRDVLAASFFVTVDGGQHHERIDFLDSCLATISSQAVVGEVQPSMAWNGNMLTVALRGLRRVVNGVDSTSHKIAALTLTDNDTGDLLEAHQPDVPGDLKWRQQVLAFRMGQSVCLANARLETLRTVTLPQPVCSLAWHGESGWLACLTNSLGRERDVRLAVFQAPLRSDAHKEVTMDADIKDVVSLEWCGSKLALADQCGCDGVRFQVVPRLRWHLLRAAGVQARAICIYWLKVTAEKSYAPGGRGRKRDLEAFETDQAHV